jgi:hypothetical protein
MFSRSTVAGEARVLSQSCLRGLCGGKTGTETRDKCFSEHFISSVDIIPPALRTLLTHHYYINLANDDVVDWHTKKTVTNLQFRGRMTFQWT